MLLFVLCGAAIHAQQSPYTGGTGFFSTYSEPVKNMDLLMLDPPYRWDTAVYTSIYILGHNSGCATVEIAGLNFKKSIEVPKDSVVRVHLPYNPAYPIETPLPLGIRISTTAPMGILQATNIGKGGIFGHTDSVRSHVMPTTASAVVPDHLLHGAHLALPFSSGSEHWYTTGVTSQCLFTILSAEDDNAVEVFFSSGTVDYNAPSIPIDTTITYHMDKGEIFSFYLPMYSYKDWDPLHVKSTNSKSFKLYKYPHDIQLAPLPIAPVAYEEMKPLGNGYHGHSFHVPPLEGNTGGLISLHATSDSTALSFNGRQAKMLDSLGFIDTCIAGPVHIEANKPLYGYLAPCPDPAANNNASSPFSVSLSSNGELIRESLFATFNEPDSLNNYVLGVVTKTNATGSFLLDGAPFPATSFTPFAADTSWSWANIHLSPGTHKAVSDSGFHAIQYTYYIHPDSLQDFHFPSYGYVLPESRPWPLDSFTFKAGTSPDSLRPFRDFDQELCPGEKLFLKPPVHSDKEWHWFFGDGSDTVTAAAGKLFSHTYQEPGTYLLWAEDADACLHGDSLSVEVAEVPLPDFSWQSTATCEGTRTHMFIGSTGADNYQWELSSGESADGPAPVFNDIAEGTTITLTAFSGKCSTTISKTYSLPQEAEEVSVPNVFTPNGDGVNDCFKPSGAEDMEGCYNLTVYNRWGTKVFQTASPTDCWTGGGASPGVYFYILKVGNEEWNGSVHLVR